MLSLLGRVIIRCCSCSLGWELEIWVRFVGVGVMLGNAGLCRTRLRLMLSFKIIRALPPHSGVCLGVARRQVISATSCGCIDSDFHI